MKLLFVAYVLAGFSGYAQLELPFTNKPVTNYSAFTVCYNQQHKQADWVAYELTKEETNSLFKRSNRFFQDRNLPVCACDADYKNTGYDRGHLAPAADMGFSQISMKESFYYTNISPQVPGFNRGIWKDLESKTREWAVEYNSVYIATGGLLSDDLEFIGNKVSVPQYFYKVIIDQSLSKGIGFIIKNEAAKEDLQTFAVPIDSVEKLTGIDFFYSLNDSVENIIEGAIHLQDWLWEKKAMTGSAIKDTTTNETIESSAPTPVLHDNAVQCSGITKSGNRCKRNTRNANGRCFDH